jgi:DNA-binding MarR family transcriptional regulator
VARRDDPGIGFLLVQLGTHAAARFAEALDPSGLEPRHVGLLRMLAANEGVSQQALGEMLGLNATRVVFLVDDMEHRGLVERRRNPNDRRSHALFVTAEGRLALTRAMVLGRALETELGTSLSAAERKQLGALLRRLAEEQGITELSLPIPAHVRNPTQPG